MSRSHWRHPRSPPLRRRQSPSDAAIAQYVEAVPSATGPVATGGPASPASASGAPDRLAGQGREDSRRRRAGAPPARPGPSVRHPPQGSGSRCSSHPSASRATLLPRSHAIPSSARLWLSRPARLRRARSLRRPRRPVPAGSCSSRCCSSRSPRRASLPGRRGASRPRGLVRANDLHASATAASRIPGGTRRRHPYTAPRASRSDPRPGSRPRGGLERWGRRPVRTGFLDPGAFAGPNADVSVARARKAGATLTRVPVFWNAVETATPDDPTDPDDPAYDWASVDRSGRKRRPRRAHADPGHHQLPEVGRRSGGRLARDVALADEARAVLARCGAALQRHVHSLRGGRAPAARAVLGGVERAERGEQPRAPADRRP